MTLDQFKALVAAYHPADVRRALAAVLACERPRTASDYRCFYTAVCLHLAIYSLPADAGSRPGASVSRELGRPRRGARHTQVVAAP